VRRAYTIRRRKASERRAYTIRRRKSKDTSSLKARSLRPHTLYVDGSLKCVACVARICRLSVYV
jgi:hypothetical protein